jgi:hypothetical protein
MRHPAVSPLLFAALVWPGYAAVAPAQQVPSVPTPTFASDARPSDPNRPTVSWGDPYDGPLIDTHAHLNPPSARRGSTQADITAAITAARVNRIVLAPAPNEGVFRNPQPTQTERLALVRTSAGRVLRLCGSEYLTDWMSDNAGRGGAVSSRTLVAKVEQLRGDLKTGTCVGVGEIGLFHFDTAGGQPVVRLPAAYPPLVAIAQVAAAAGLPMDIHAEPFEPNGTISHHAEIYGTLGVLFRDAPGLKLIYSHGGMTNPHNARALLEALPGLMMNLRFAPREPWKHLDPIVNEAGRLYADWAELLKQMPDRFLIGSDFLFGWNPRPTEDYARLINVTRRILGGLPPEVARRIASVNAQRLFGFAPPPSESPTAAR